MKGVPVFIMENVTEYRVNLPYPEVESGPDNRRTVLLLMEDYAGMVSELSAITQYVYQHIVLEDAAEEVSEVMRHISIIEMKHLELLGEAILKLGGNPMYASRGRFWNARNVSYVTRVREVLNENINGENSAIRQYRRHIEQTANQSVKRLLERIILDEELHIRIFNALLEKYR